ncbi:MAG: ketosteroid isomerase [Crocinitomicaceae bacterium]|nr:ketosteroid isomerase [Crocinitomicaceae bacterium]|tara:strand:- start:8084 stop:8479 length:396 start_codon:yes stop_codon:yes gene_type:complete
MNSNVELVRELYDAFSTGDGKKLASLFHPQIEWQQMEGFPNGGTFVGTNDVFEKVFGLFPMYWKGWGAVAQEFYGADDKVFVIGYYKGVSIESGKELKSPLIHLYTLKDGLITHFRQFTDTHLVQNALRNG